MILIKLNHFKPQSRKTHNIHDKHIGRSVLLTYNAGE